MSRTVYLTEETLAKVRECQLDRPANRWLITALVEEWMQIANVDFAGMSPSLSWPESPQAAPGFTHTSFSVHHKPGLNAYIQAKLHAHRSEYVK